MHGPNSDSAASFRETEHPHLGKDSVPASTGLSLHGPPPDPFTTCVSVMEESSLLG